MAKVTSKVEIIDAKAGLVKITPKRKKVAIIACGRTRYEAPYDNNEWEFWGLNEIAQPRAERWFELHPMEVQSHRELEWLKKLKKPVYLLECCEEVPCGVQYPFARIMMSIPGARCYFTSTFAYQIALAIYEEFEEIGLWGAPFFIGSPREQTVERACLEYWLGLAAGKGIKITIHPDDKLLYQPHRYGYDYYEEKRYVEGLMSYLGKEIHVFHRHLVRDGGDSKYVGGDYYYSFLKGMG
jgi:hypothetical protein